MDKYKFKEFLSVNETAEFLGISPENVYKKIKRGLLPLSPHGKPYRVVKSKLLEGKNESDSES